MDTARPSIHPLIQTRPHLTPDLPGEGAKTDLFLLGSAADSLFQSNVGLEFDEDSPSFRRRLRAMGAYVHMSKKQSTKQGALRCMMYNNA